VIGVAACVDEDQRADVEVARQADVRADEDRRVDGVTAGQPRREVVAEREAGLWAQVVEVTAEPELASGPSKPRREPHHLDARGAGR
jgi:hypothetical protein